MCKQHKFEGSVKWYEHIPKNVANNENFKILWDLTIKTDKELDLSRPDIAFVDKQNRNCLIINVAFPSDTRRKGQKGS